MGVLCWSVCTTAAIAEWRGKEGRGGNTGSHYEIRAEESGNWWDERVMLVIMVMEWANAVSARRRGEPNPAVTGAKPLWSSATRSLSEQPTINYFTSKRNLKRKLE